MIDFMYFLVISRNEQVVTDGCNEQVFLVLSESDISTALGNL